MNYSRFILTPNQRPRKMSHAYRALLKRRQAKALRQRLDAHQTKKEAGK